VAALNGETLSTARQPIPGGILGILSPASLPTPAQQTLKAMVANGRSGLTGTLELARPADTIGFDKDNIGNQKGVGLSLPAKVHLENPFLGSNCYIGSSANPVVLNLTSGSTSPPSPARPIKGTSGKLSFEDQEEIAELVNSALVDNTFSVPGASGCGGPYSTVIDALIDTRLGLPSAAGRNAIVQDNRVLLADLSGVLDSER
jgi:hypothetical protein